MCTRKVLWKHVSDENFVMENEPVLSGLCWTPHAFAFRIKILQPWFYIVNVRQHYHLYIVNLCHHRLTLSSTLSSFLLRPLITQVVIVPYEKEDPSHRGASKQFFNQNLYTSKYESESDQKENLSHLGVTCSFPPIYWKVNIHRSQHALAVI